MDAVAPPPRLPRRGADRSRFHQKDVTRAVRGFVQAGLVVARAEIDPNGRIIIVAANGAALPANEWDEVLR